jgi:hypothetical protein
MKKSLFTALAVGLGLTANLCAQVPSYVPTNGLVGWWPFNGNANDESGNGNDGVINGFLSYSNDRNGLLNSSCKWPNSLSSSNYVNLNNLSQYIPNSISISCWIYIDGATTNSRIISSGEMGLIINQDFGSNVNLKCSYNPAGSGIWPSTFLISKNTWHHIVFTSNYTTNTANFYVDGDQTDLASGGTPNNPLNSDWNLGRKSISAYDGYGGDIDDIGIWNRALTQQEITYLYDGCMANITTQPTNQTVNQTNSAQFIVNANSGCSFQWQTDLGLGFQNLSNAGQYTGANNDTLVVSNATVSNNNQQFHCVVNSGSCSDTSDVAVFNVSTSGIEELTSQGNINLYPNPTQSSFEIQTNLVFNKIEIRDMKGRVVKTENSGKTINIASLQKGTYLVQLIDEKSKIIAVQRVIKE